MRKNIILTLVALAASMCSNAWAGIVVAGCDDLTTNPSSFFDFTSLSGGQVGVVHFMSYPVGAGPGNTDTVVCRLQDATINAGSAPPNLTPGQIAALPNAIGLQITALSMESTAPVNLGGSFFDVFISLDPANLANDIGKMAIYSNGHGGNTFTSFFDVFFEAQFVDASNPALDFNVFGSTVLQPRGGVATWQPKASILVLPACFTETNSTGAPGAHDACGATQNGLPVDSDFNPGAVREPASISLMGAGLLGLVAFVRRRRSLLVASER